MDYHAHYLRRRTHGLEARVFLTKHKEEMANYLICLHLGFDIFTSCFPGNLPVLPRVNVG